MQKYFINDDELANKIITGDDAFHIKSVMRGRIGDEVLVGNNGKTYLVRLLSIDKVVQFEILDELTGNNELPVFVYIFQGYPKGDKIEDIIKHGTELGAYSITPTLMKRSVFKLDEKKKDSKLIRFNKIAKEAAEQSYRNIVPTVDDIINLKAINFDSFDAKILCYEEDAKSGELTNFKAIVKNLKPGARVAIVVGPEGGIDDSEHEYLTNKGFISCAIGKRILRTETVVFYCLSAIGYEMELK